MNLSSTRISNNSNNNTSQCGSRFRMVWGDPAVGSLTPTDMPTRRDADSQRPIKKDFENILKKKDFVKSFNGKIKDTS